MSNSWPTPQVDWGQLTGRLRHDDLVCVVHGRVDAVLVDEQLPVCPRCAQLLSRIVCDRRTGTVVSFAEPAPAVCAGPDRHPLTGGTARLSWRSCQCPAANPGAGGHRIWGCGLCPAGTPPALYPACTAPVDDRAAVRQADHRPVPSGPPGGPPARPGADHGGDGSAWGPRTIGVHE